MERVVYIIGAGFSQPFGLPLVSNFLEKAKDIYYHSNNRDKYNHFLKVFESIKEMHIAKTYYDTDLTNIEEILSILEMGNSLSSDSDKKDFISFVCDVIEYYSPVLKDPPLNINDQNWMSIFWQGDKEKIYGKFISAALGLTWSHSFTIAIPHNIVTFHKSEGNEFSYSIISLNYDLIIEMFIKLILERTENKSVLFSRANDHDLDDNITYLAKLHGSMDTKEIIPPTWNKTINSHIQQEWKLAYNLLSRANHIRFLGYSLPQNDAYIKYLLKASILNNAHLKSCDIICLDDKNKTIKSRYENFILYNKLRFANARVEHYLEKIVTNNSVHGQTNTQRLLINNLYHDRFMSENS